MSFLNFLMYLRCFKCKCMSVLNTMCHPFGLIVSLTHPHPLGLTLTLTLALLVLTPSKVVVADSNHKQSNITLLDLYPELRSYLWNKALQQSQNQLVPLTEDYNKGYMTHFSGYSYPNVATSSSGVNGVSGSQPAPVYSTPLVGSGIGSAVGPVSRDHSEDMDPHDSYNYQKEVLKYFHPFGSPEFYDSWKFKEFKQADASGWGSNSNSNGWSGSGGSNTAGSGWSSGGLPFWDGETDTHELSHDLSKDFSCLAGLLGLTTLKKLKFAVIFKKLKAMGIFAIAFKLGVLLSPVAIPLLFPIILLVTAVKILPLVLIIVLLLKILKKQVKIKKPFGKFLDQTGSLFFDDVDRVTERVWQSDEECVDKLSCSLDKSKSSRGKGRTSTGTRSERRMDVDKVKVKGKKQRYRRI